MMGIPLSTSEFTVGAVVGEGAACQKLLFWSSIPPYSACPYRSTQVTATAILGLGTAEHGWKLWQKGIISKIIKVWIVSPVLALVMSYTRVRIYIEPSPYLLVVLGPLVVASIGVKSLYDTIQHEKRTGQ
ncbi:hypothetical protein [Paenibacillus xerothermodurans]|uniref:hypothetical protein n=1 Tax=Paenibacillus xerothermodurans TaxID=1977292 RepID=UPI0026A56B18